MNPWRDLIPDGPDYVLPADLPYVETFNQRQTSDYLKIRTTRLPEPRLGPVNAPVMVLQLNPSYDQDQIDAPLPRQQAEDAIAALRNCNSRHAHIENGNPWWKRRYSHLISDVPDLSKRLCTIEYFPYPSARFAHMQVRLPSQGYTFDLVRAAIRRGALLLITRGCKIWLGAVPELSDHINQTVFLTKNPRSAVISPKNLPRGIYKRVVEALRSR